MKDRTVLWIFLAFVLGFALPVCSCAGTGLLILGALSRMAGERAPVAVGFGDAVAVMRLDGTISSGSEEYFTTQGITPGRVADLLEQADADPSIKAVVVRVNSPGGSVVASDEIYRALLEFEKPVRWDLKPGLHFKWPIVGRVQKYDNRLRVFHTTPIEQTLGDQKTIILQAYLCWRISDPLKFYDVVSNHEREYRLRVTQGDALLMDGFVDVPPNEQEYSVNGVVRVHASPYVSKLSYFDVSVLDAYDINSPIDYIRSALDSIEGYVKANAKNSSDHAYKVGDVVDLYPVKGSDGRVIARAPDGRVVLFAKDSQPDEGKQVRAIIVVSKPTYYIAKPVAEAGEK